MNRKLMVRCSFSGWVFPDLLPSNREGAKAALLRAGYAIVWDLPYVDYDPAWVSGDDCFDVIIEGPDDPQSMEAVRDAVEAIIADEYGGEVPEWGVWDDREGFWLSGT